MIQFNSTYIYQRTSTFLVVAVTVIGIHHEINFFISSVLQNGTSESKKVKY